MILLVKPTEVTIADRILELAEALTEMGNKLIVADKTVTDVHVARVKLALDFERRPGIVFQAIMENWDQPRIIREMY